MNFKKESILEQESVSKEMKFEEQLRLIRKTISR